MQTSYQIVTAPASEPVTTAEAKDYLRIDTADDDTLIAELITAARIYVECYTGRQLVTATWDYFQDRFTDVIRLPLTHVASITSVKYLDTANTQQTLVDGTDYTTDINALRSRIMPYYGTTWPSTRSQEFNTVEVRFIAGVADTAVSKDLKIAIKMIVTAMYEHRSAQACLPFEDNMVLQRILQCNRIIEV